MAQLDAGIGGSKSPVDGGLFLVALGFKTPDSQIERGRVAKALFERTTGQDAQFNFSHVEPRALLGSGVKAQPSKHRPGQGRLNGLVQRGGTGGLAIIQDQVNAARLGILGVHQPRWDVVCTWRQEASGSKNINRWRVPLR